MLNEDIAPDDVLRYGHYKFPTKQGGQKGGGEYEGWWKFGRVRDVALVDLSFSISKSPVPVLQIAY